MWGLCKTCFPGLFGILKGNLDLAHHLAHSVEWIRGDSDELVPRSWPRPHSAPPHTTLLSPSNCCLADAQESASLCCLKPLSLLFPGEVISLVVPMGTLLIQTQPMPLGEPSLNKCLASVLGLMFIISHWFCAFLSSLYHCQYLYYQT